MVFIMMQVFFLIRRNSIQNDFLRVHWHLMNVHHSRLFHFLLDLVIVLVNNGSFYWICKMKSNLNSLTRSTFCWTWRKSFIINMISTFFISFNSEHRWVTFSIGSYSSSSSSYSNCHTTSINSWTFLFIRHTLDIQKLLR